MNPMLPKEKKENTKEEENKKYKGIGSTRTETKNL